MPEPGVVSTVPATHAPCGKHAASLFTVVKVPAAQTPHVRLMEAEGELLTKEPGRHVAHAAHDSALADELKAPDVQPEQVRFAVALPAEEMNCPATQLVCAAHAVAESASLSQKPAPQAAIPAAPPAQYVPAGQAMQTGGAVSVPGVV